ncbi:hypothetical protein [Conexibacter woesei]|uniref:Uncharacterized protein n=1 Tax=Conexibacter woesei (strain DSM 14684 / CCUG 47730 / CIP 108061 / JCM 11494 / NBRC 100937 / ID131577) TaxID=469383 RepID=D3F7Q2_CONWI|nr:hypothetical protein [Conexibacter woesei]ADB50914.1 hypothetical protein Cwoe_2492 [Conexibacter woesei DSM 14684]
MHAIPTLDDLASDPMTHRFEDTFNPPGLTNFLGAAQVDHDLVAVRSVNFPPLGSGDTISGQLFLDGRFLRSLGVPITVVWRPDRVIRSARVGELEIETTTVCPPGETAVVVDVRVTNHGGEARELRLGLALASAVAQPAEPWLAPVPPSDANRLDVDRARGAIVGSSPATGAACVQGFDAAPALIVPGASAPADSGADGAAWRGEEIHSLSRLEAETRIEPGATWRIGYVQALAHAQEQALETFDRLAADVPGAVRAAEQLWARELTDAFTPGAGATSGSLPVLETSNDALRELYWAGVLGVLWFRRDSPDGVLGRSYDTLMPRYWQSTTFIWDYSLSSTVHALLDPQTMRRQLEHWIATDIHTHFGTEWLTGAPVGYWYSVNDFAMTRLVRDYVRFSGERDWLDRQIATADGGARTVADHLGEWATAWRGLRGRHALADYGGTDNLLECVSSYVHEVASLNAMNVWCMRVAAELAAVRGDNGAAAELRVAADALVGDVQELYVAGSGHWAARQPGGELVSVAHAYDFNTVAMAIAGDLPDAQRDEMVAFFARELQSETWMRALSASDPDAAFSNRPDHQWNGAYTAWPADAAHALIRLGRDDLAAAWLPGLASSAHQGPFAQGHFVEGIVPAHADRGAPKGPPQEPYLMDWACSSAGAFADLVIQGFFGVDVPFDGSAPRATPRLAAVDPDARLRGLVVAGRSYDVSTDGIVASA